MRDEKEIFCDAVRQQQKAMYALAFSIVKNEEDAADIIQDAILKAYCHREGLRDTKKFKSWILSIVHNTAVEFLRSHRDTVDIDQQWDLAVPESSLDTAARLTVWDAVQQLPLSYRTVVILFYYNGLPTQTIAQITESSAVAVRKRLFRARKMLAERLNQEDFEG